MGKRKRATCYCAIAIVTHILCRAQHIATYAMRAIHLDQGPQVVEAKLGRPPHLAGLALLVVGLLDAQVYCRGDKDPVRRQLSDR